MLELLGDEMLSFDRGRFFSRGGGAVGGWTKLRQQLLPTLTQTASQDACNVV